jgi:hypothetical protein
LACAYRFWTECSLNGILVARGDQPILPAPAFKKICAQLRSKESAVSIRQHAIALAKTRAASS